MYNYLRNIIVGLGLFYVTAICAQELISGKINSYYEVQTVGVNSVNLAAPPADLNPGDKVLMVYMKGYDMLVELPMGSPIGDGIIDANDDVGNYELLAVKSVAGNNVEFTANIKRFYDDNEKIQLVKIYEAENAIINGPILADAWDGSKGGVVAMVIFKKLIIQDDINVSGSGFRGAIPVSDYTGGCHAHDTAYFTDARAGRKGEGITSHNFGYLYGTGNNFTGGGGGAGYFGGGGGGANYARGGRGGYQDTSVCGTLLRYGFSGKDLKDDVGLYALNRISFGGGGGSSTEDASNAATAGGNGGGLVLIISDTLEAVGNPEIIASGQAVSGIAVAGGAGGGAGGTVLLDVDNYISNLSVDVSGGNGGNTSTSSGGGGGGGGGVVFHAGSSLPGNLNIDLTRGSGGTTLTGSNGFNGRDGGTLGNLSLILNGFVFNSINGTDTICQGQAPDVLTGSTPKGSASPFIHQWLESTDSINWSTAAGSGDMYIFQPAPLYQTTWFTRVIRNADLQYDTALVVKVFVYDSLSGNSLNVINDTVCSGNSPGMLVGNPVTGGNSAYDYIWQSSENQVTWSNRGAEIDLEEGNIINTTYYRRIVQSAVVCIDTSSIETIRVLEPISGNLFSQDTMICQGLDAGLILPTAAANGGGEYRYSWLVSDNDTSYSIIPGETEPGFSPGVLYQDQYYKRVVASGKNDACLDTTGPKLVDVADSISNNGISSDSIRYCAGAIPLDINGQLPEGGAGGYIYQWYRFTGSDWEIINNGTGLNLSFTDIIEDTTLFNRVVSDNLGICMKSSNLLKLDIIPYINNSLVSPDENICEGQQPVAFSSETTASGGAGAGTYSYQWQQSINGGSDWSSADGISDQITYVPPVLTDSTLYRREVNSQICQHFSDTIVINVYPYIDANLVEGGAVQYTCFNTPAEITGSIPTGGNGLYSYQWQQSSDNTSWTDGGGPATGQNYSSVALADSAYFRRLVFSGETDQCKDTAIPVLIRINPLPVGSITSRADTVCAGELISIEYTFEGNGPWDVGFGEAGNILHSRDGVTSSSDTLQFSLDQTADISIAQLIDDSLCSATDLSGLVNAQVYSIPQADAGADDEICALTYSLNATLSILDELSIGFWTSSEGRFDDPSSPTAQYTASSYGTKTLTWTETNWSCTDQVDLQLVFYEQPGAAEAGEDQILDYAFETNLSATLPLVGTGSWTTSSSEATINDTSATDTRVDFEFNSIGGHVFTWSVENGVCMVMSDSMTVQINDLKVYKGFSPNGDGVNDDFILVLSGQKNVELLILSRYGLEVFKTSGNEKIEWDGRNNNGDELPSGTYFYIITEDGTTKDKGYIELRR